MAKLNASALRVPITNNTSKCPVCDELLQPVAVVKLTHGVVRRVAVREGGEAVMSVNIQAEVVSIEINHTCERIEKKNA